jgi:hypothetical protein
MHPWCSGVHGGEQVKLVFLQCEFNGFLHCLFVCFIYIYI